MLGGIMLKVIKNFLSEENLSVLLKYKGLSFGSAESKEDLNTIKSISDLIKIIIKEEFGIQNIYLENFGIKTNFAGEMVALHYDASGITPGRREYAAHIYLNDNFTGGEISYPNQNFIEKPEKNMLILFPTSEDYPHEMKQILSGERTAMLMHFTTNMDLAYLEQAYNRDI